MIASATLNADGNWFANGEWHEVTVSAIGDHIQVYADGELVIDAYDDTLSSGAIGLNDHYANTCWDFVDVTDLSPACDLCSPNGCDYTCLNAPNADPNAVVTAAPGEEICFPVDYEVSGTPGHIIYVGGAFEGACQGQLYSGVPGSTPAAGSGQFCVTAPQAPGVYPVYVAVAHVYNYGEFCQSVSEDGADLLQIGSIEVADTGCATYAWSAADGDPGFTTAFEAGAVEPYFDPARPGYVVEFPAPASGSHFAAASVDLPTPVTGDFELEVELDYEDDGYNFNVFLAEDNFVYNDMRADQSDWVRGQFYHGWFTVLAGQSQNDAGYRVNGIEANFSEPTAGATYLVRLSRTGDAMSTEFFKQVGGNWTDVGSTTWTEYNPADPLSKLFFVGQGNHLWGDGVVSITRICLSTPQACHLCSPTGCDVTCLNVLNVSPANMVQVAPEETATFSLDFEIAGTLGASIFVGGAFEGACAEVLYADVADGEPAVGSGGFDVIAPSEVGVYPVYVAVAHASSTPEFCAAVASDAADKLQVGAIYVIDPNNAPVPGDVFVNGAIGDDAWDGLSPSFNGVNGPKRTIQAGIDVAVSGDTVLVADGTYSGAGNIDLDTRGKAIAVRSASGNAEACVIDCQRAGRGFYIHSGETASTLIDGLTITNGHASSRGGGIYCDGSAPTISNCRIVGNEAASAPNSAGGGGICVAQGAAPNIIDCLIAENACGWAGGGGVAALSHGVVTLTRCTVVDNIGWLGGGLLAYDISTLTATQCRISGNWALGTGGGAAAEYGAHLALSHCLITHNAAAQSEGGGVAVERSGSTAIDSCTIAFNTADKGGGGVFFEDPLGTIRNSIIWHNAPDAINADAQLDVAQSNVEGGWALGTEIIDLDPLLTADGHLTAGSSCINTGATAGASVDIDGETRPTGGGVDMGADEYVDSDAIPDDLPDWWEAAYFGAAGTAPNADPDPDGDLVSTLDEYRVYASDPNGGVWHVDAALGNDAWDGTAASDQGGGVGPKRTLQAALDVTAAGGTLFVAPGTYSGAGNYELDLHRRPLLIKTLGGQPAVIDAQGAGRVIDPDTVGTGVTLLEGFTLRGAPEQATLTLRSPHGGLSRYEAFTRGDILPVRWESAGAVGDIKIELMYDSSALGDPSQVTRVDAVMTPATPNDGAFDWVVPVNQHPNSDYFVRISAVDNPDLHAVSGHFAAGGASDTTAAPQPPLAAASDDAVTIASSTTGSYSASPDWRWPLRATRGHLILRDCTLDSDGAAGLIGGLGVNLARVTLDDVTLRDASGIGGWLDSSLIMLDGPVTIDDASAVIESCRLRGDGALVLTEDSALRVVGPYYRQTTCFADIMGVGDIWIDADAELRLADGAVLDLSGGAPGPADWGTVHINGALVASSATVRNTNIDVKLAKLTGAMNIENNDIHLLESSSGFGGEFFVEGSSVISGNYIVSDGDRYLDFDPDPTLPQRPTMTQNTIDVRITQGAGAERGELLEMRARDYDAGTPTNPQSRSGAFAAPGSAGFTADPSANWVLRTLEILPDCKVSLTNRQGFDFQQDPNHPETVYVETLKLHPGAVLNTALQTLYYGEIVDEADQPLTRDPNDLTAPLANGSRIIDVPLLGFSLKIIAMEDEEEFEVRVGRRIADPGANNPNRGGRIARVAAPLPNAPNNHAMRMQTVATGNAESVAAKGAFARATEDAIIVAFDYRFVAEPGEPGEIDVYLSDDPDVGAGRVWIASIWSPAPGLPGSVGDSRFAAFFGKFPRGGLNFRRGTYIELELSGEGAVVEIDNWDPSVACSLGQCGNFDNPDDNPNTAVTAVDFLYLVGEIGNHVVDSADADHANWCVDALSGDNFIDLEDLLAYDGYMHDGAGYQQLCNRYAWLPQSPGAAVPTAPAAPAHPPANSFVVAGKDPASQSDYLYPLDEAGALVGPRLTPVSPATEPDMGVYRGNGRLAVNAAGALHQLHATEGLLRLSDGAVVMRPFSAAFNGADVYVGVDGDGPVMRVPVRDVAFDASDPQAAYITPVVVDSGSTAPYYAAARVRLGSPPGYDPIIEALYGDDPALAGVNVNCDPPACSVVNTQHLREIEVDRWGNVFVTSAHGLNQNSWVMVYPPAGPELALQLLDPADPLELIVESPAALTLVDDGDALYVASGVTHFGAAAVTIYRFDIERGPDHAVTGLTYDALGSIDIDSMRSVVSMAQHPCTQELWVLGFADDPNETPEEWEIKKFADGDPLPFFPALAKIAGGSAAAVASPLDATELSAPVSGAFHGVPSLPGDLNCDAAVSVADGLIWLQRITGAGQTAPPPGVSSAEFTQADLDGDGDADLVDFAAMQGVVE